MKDSLLTEDDANKCSLWTAIYSRAVVHVLLALALAPPRLPAWIDRAHIAPSQFIVTYRLADVLGSPVVEAVVVDRDPTDGTMDVSVVDSRFDPPRVVRQATVRGRSFRWLRAGTRDGLARNEIALDTADKGTEAAYLLRVGPAFKLALVRKTHGRNISPRVFSH
jgi:hypothetical protein